MFAKEMLFGLHGPTRLSRAADFGSVEVACLYSFLPMLYPKLFKVFKAMQELTVAQSIS